MAAPISFQVEGANQLEALAKRLKSLENGKDIRRALTKRLGAAAKPLVPDIRRAVQDIPSKGSAGSAHSSRSAMSSRATGSLRQAISRAVQQKTSLSGRNVGVRLRIDGTKLPADQRGLPKFLEGLKPWRHPVFGHDTWVSQEAHPYFFKTIQPHITQMQAEVAQTLNDITALIEHGSQE